ncbi:RDD family protein [Staphylococcus chromogenes]|nr:RDD family protein [Staphylococcus chromogenes]
MATLGQQDNLYTQLHLDPAASTKELALALARRDAQLSGQGLPDSAPDRQRTLVAYGILSKPESRKLYDDAIVQHRKLQDFELEHLANFGAWPVIDQPFEQPATAPVPAVPESAHVVAPSAVRPPMFTRLWVAFLDTFAALTISGVVVSQLPSEGAFLNVFLLTLIAVLYFVLGDVLLGASPFKFMFGYTVRDVRTHEKLSFAQSAQRNWWRILALVPAVGPVLSVVAGLTCGASITPSNEQRGSHDRLSGAEVVRRDG